jgi:cellulose synthase/poly-beta-1,6-N-acetylglucosamine synthase-like glycosyltransferase
MLMPDTLETGLRWAVLGLYFGCLGVLTLYGLHRWYLVSLYLRHRHEPRLPARRFPVAPVLTVQLPLYNEMYVAERLIDGICALDYPRERLEIQVLDDSTDETTGLVAALVARRRSEGFDVVHLRRGDRVGFKAGALAAGQLCARGGLIAVFDADFLPAPDFARRLVDYFTDPEVGMVQARWGHLNPDHSALTRVQSMLLDGHFVIEHTARNRSGRFFNFNGTAGIWRKRCITDAGGWQHDTLTEDLDLSYRAQLRGWKFVFVPEHVAPAELPVEVGSFKLQQHRWAKGSIQTARKLLPRILRSDLAARVKLESLAHLTANLGYVLMTALALLVVPAVFLRAGISPWLLLAVDLPLFAFSSMSVAAFYLVAQREALGSWRGIARWVPALMAIGIGLSINNARAVIEALTGHASGFRRTPKYNLRLGESPMGRRYRGRINRDTWIELSLGTYFTIATAAAIAEGLWGAVPFLSLFLVGYSFTAVATIVQSTGRAQPVPATQR